MKTRKTTNNGREYWCLDYGVRDGVRRRKFFENEHEATQALKSAQRETRNIGRAWDKLPDRSRAETIRLLQEIELSGHTLRQVWEAFRQNGKPPVSMPFDLAIQDFCRAKRVAGRRSRYVEGLEAYLRLFSKGRETIPVHTIGRTELEDWFNRRDEKPQTRIGNTTRLSSFFTYGMKAGWIKDNPCRLLETITVDRHAPRILTVRQVAKLLVATRRIAPEMMAYVVLGVFAGIRPDELQRLDWSAFNAHSMTVTVDAAASKVRSRRVVQLHHTAVAWLEPLTARGSIAPIYSRLVRLRRAIFERARLPKVQDILRHTAASYLLALHQDINRVCLSLDNSPAVARRHYLGLVSPADCARFWSLLPKKSPAC